MMKPMSTYLNTRAAKLLMVLPLLALTLVACRDEPEDPVSHLPEEVLMINNFVHKEMNHWYFWNTSMPDIDPGLEPDPEDYFYRLLKLPEDEWSFITDDVAALENLFAGITKSKGYSFQLYYLQNSTQFIGIIEYVYRNSPASNAGLKRGDIIYRINGELITSTNYLELLALDNIVITLAYPDQHGYLQELLPMINIAAVENLVQHPVIATNVIQRGNKIIGYLAYSAFISNFDSYLESVFSNFKALGVNELVLDLRYNGGGAVSSAKKLANMIAPPAAVGNVFVREVWNSNLRGFNTESRIAAHPNNLGLSRVFILTTEGTSSASEMIIYGLRPHMEVIQVGGTTHGKYYASVMITDNNSYPARRRHNWAIQPIVLRAENKDNNINYLKGLIPDHPMVDNIYNAQLGDPDEHFLAAVLSYIETGVFRDAGLKSATAQLTAVEGFKELMNPLHGVMITDIPSNLLTR